MAEGEPPADGTVDLTVQSTSQAESTTQPAASETSAPASAPKGDAPAEKRDAPAGDEPVAEQTGGTPPATDGGAVDGQADGQTPADLPAETKSAAEEGQPAQSEATKPLAPLSQGSAAEKSELVTPMVLGPEPGVGSPYLYWDVRETSSSSSALIGGATFQVEGPRSSSSSNWGQTYSISDCVTAPCTGADRDPDPGEFQVISGQGGVGTMTTSQRWRVRAASTSTSWEYDGSTYSFSANNWNEMSSANWANSGGVSSYDFGNFVPQKLLTTRDIIVTKRIFAEPTTTNGPVGNNYSDTVGSNFRLYTNQNSAPGQPTGFHCEITAGGQCTITVTDVQNGGSNYNDRFWVVEEAPTPGSVAGENTYSNPELYVGSYSGPQDIRRLVGLTKRLTAGSTALTMPMTSSDLSSSDLPGTNATTAEAGSFGAVVGSYNNPSIVPKCEAAPLRIGIIIDQSASISSNQWTTFREALVGSSNGTAPSSVLGLLRSEGALVSILGFGSNIASPNGWHHGNASTPQTLPTNNSTLRDLIPGTRPGGSGNATNWDSALSAFQGSTSSYDMVLFVTDGAPNYILNGTGPSSTAVTLRSLEAPMYAANALKRDGVRVVAVGVGAGASGSAVAKNLRAVSGQTAGSDYLQGDWDALKQILSDIVTAATCQVPVDVSKTLKRADNTTTTLAAGWDFTASLEGGTSSAVSLTGAAEQTTASGDAGKARWTVRFTQPAGQTAVLKLSEDAQPGWTLDSVQCTLDAQPLTVTVSGTSVTIPGLKPNSGALSCVFTNREATPASVVVNKQWVIDGETVAHGSQPDGMDAALSLDPAGSGSGDLGWGQTRTGFVIGDKLKIGEATTFDPALVPGCVLTGSTIAGTGITGSVALASTGYETTLGSASNAYMVTNTVQCQRLTLVKNVENSFGGSATSDDWNDGLFAQLGASPRLVFDSGDTKYVATGSYVLSEADIDGYSQDDLACTGGTLNSGTVTVAAGANVVCTFTNVDNPGSVTWTKIAADTSDLLGGSEWLLTGPGLGSGVTVTDCIETDAADCTSLDKDPAAGAFLLEGLHWGEYTLTETSAPLGYMLDSTSHQFTISGAALAVSVDPIENTLATAPTLPLTGGLGADFYKFAGLGILLLGAALFIARRAWIRKHATNA
ncbi:SpaA isopeptide-forming pilin-related protein [Microbacterium alcoholitolerans]|uniref:SpaA isopeptide-forming pilin-related protein n=1 Tax=unclassified Microbacterium TaxID=2609290 RepID=UPI003D178FD0